MAAVTICSDFGAPKIKSATVSTVSPSICHEVMGLDAMILVFWMLSFKPTFSLSSFTFTGTSLVAQTLNRLPTMRENRIQSLGQEDLLEKEMATHSSFLAWKIPWMGEAGRLQSMKSQRVRHDWVTSLHFTFSSRDSLVLLRFLP